LILVIMKLIKNSATNTNKNAIWGNCTLKQRAIQSFNAIELLNECKKKIYNFPSGDSPVRYREHFYSI